ncbi:ATP-dependent helicase HrpB [Halomonas huangheensis]|uniref:ATP-dependent helicase n=1 Tax=Halomonas huangheensis TaxID=1178482 RepID=W1NB40_9GAMM|nr:ATP-dependent helicase HrpB [Halomonas huangheensis]ALM52722.1 ATP-dependent helicase [Halomonas huangheensis]ERL52744.1 hypothetical protein BJB45_15810 [Halomonas huangheensis]
MDLSAELPIESRLPALSDALQQHTRVMLVAEPGAGKTTRVPLTLLDTDWCRGDDGDGRLLLLEPRRVAARLAAGHMAAQLGEDVGQRIGYRMRGESRVSAATRLEVVTQGVLTRMLQDDPMLEGVTGIIFDEFHERSLEADLGLALALDVQQALRDDLRLLVMSATLDVAALKAVLGEATPLIECPGRQFPVTTSYRPSAARSDAAEHQARVVAEALAHEGDVLVILPGVAEIERLQRVLNQRHPELSVLPLHGRMALDAQRRALCPLEDGRRKVVLATAIAESSVTVDGVRTVIDVGQERIPVFQPRTGMTRLATRRVNRASADQRRGRAGRQAAGHCYRLWAEEQPLVPHAEAEMHQADLATLAFELARWGVADPVSLHWVTPPPAGAWYVARQQLQKLGLLGPDGSVSSLGRKAGRWPVSPALAVMLEHAVAQGDGATSEACGIAAWLEGRSGGTSRDVDSCLSELWQSRERAGQWWRDTRRLARIAGVEPRAGHQQASARLLMRAWPERIAQRVAVGRFRMANGGMVRLPENQSLAHSELLLIVDTDGDPREAMIRHAARLELADLEAGFAETHDWRERVEWCDQSKRLIGERVRGLGAVVLERRPLTGPPSAEARREALVQALLREPRLPLNDAAEALRTRVQLLRAAHDEGWPDLSDEAMHAELDEWLGPHLENLSRLDQVRCLPWTDLLRQRIPWQLLPRLDELAPTRMTLPSGDSAALRYDIESTTADQDSAETRVVPVLAAKLQALLGWVKTPRIVDGRVAVRIELLSPAQRPLARTMDLESFWTNVYPEVRKEMRGRYPRHPWPEDPLTATPTMRTNRALRRGK